MNCGPSLQDTYQKWLKGNNQKNINRIMGAQPLSICVGIACLVLSCKRVAALNVYVRTCNTVNTGESIFCFR